VGLNIGPVEGRQRGICELQFDNCGPTTGGASAICTFLLSFILWLAMNAAGTSIIQFMFFISFLLKKSSENGRYLTYLSMGSYRDASFARTYPETHSL
jgi:hypothetical protein